MAFHPAYCNDFDCVIVFFLKNQWEPICICKVLKVNHWLQFEMLCGPPYKKHKNGAEEQDLNPNPMLPTISGNLERPEARLSFMIGHNVTRYVCRSIHEVLTECLIRGGVQALNADLSVIVHSYSHSPIHEVVMNSRSAAGLCFNCVLLCNVLYVFAVEASNSTSIGCNAH